MERTFQREPIPGVGAESSPLAPAAYSQGVRLVRRTFGEPDWLMRRRRLRRLFKSSRALPVGRARLACRPFWARAARGVEIRSSVWGGAVCAVCVALLAIGCGGQSGTTATSGGAVGSVDAGSGHSCAIAADATITCWGNNNSGQADPPPGTFKTVAAGAGHSCAIAFDGTVACWGNDDSGQADPPAGTFKALAAGWDHSCAIASDDTVACWGSKPSPEGVRWVTSKS